MSGQIECALAVLMVSDLKRSQAFYRDVIGCEVTDWWAIRDGLTGLALKLHEAADSADVRPNGPAKDGGRCDVSAYVVSWKAQDELYAEFREKGAAIFQEPTIYAEGGPWREFAIQDPDGYVIAFGGIEGEA